MTTPPDTSRQAVVKLGGSTLGAHDTSLADIAGAHASGRAIVVVHGGGAAISASLERSGIQAKFVRGLRATDAATLDVVVAVLAGSVNKALVAELRGRGAPAVGLSGVDGGVLQARRYDEALGFVGEIESVDIRLLEHLLLGGYLPVIAPIAVEQREGGAPQLLNTNADTAAGAVAAALRASQLVFLTDVDGVMGGERRVLPRLDAAQASKLIDDGVAEGGMIPKLQAAVRAAGVGCATRIVNGTTAGVLAQVLVGEDIGTVVV